MKHTPTPIAHHVVWILESGKIRAELLPGHDKYDAFIVQACNAHDGLVDVLQEFTADVEAVASREELTTLDPYASDFDWPDLLVTYQAAKALLKEEKK